ncbi:MAG: glycosyltransferase [Clostridia bacterium]|nr:glycosyltransferase [Clostridia bacterium]
MPMVSFLMSNYKTPPAYLRRALDSMLAQTMTDFEAVIINDGVKDESYEVLLEYAAKDSRIRLIENETNLGLAASLNKGIEQCRGKYIARMDTDDICYPERLQLQTEYMDANPNIMFSGAWADVFDDDENEIKYQWQPVMCPHEEYRIRLLFSNNPCLLHPTVFFRTGFLKHNTLRYSEDPLFRFSEDYELWTRCADRGSPGILEKAVIKYRDAQIVDRITIRHAREMTTCVQNTQQKLFNRLDITLTEESRLLNMNLLAGRKPYDIRYKKWMNLILKQNKHHTIYDQRIMKRLFHERWYNIVYYGIAKKKTFIKRLRCFLSFYPDGYLRFIKDLPTHAKRGAST